MECIAIGIDISKGRCDVAILNQSGTLLAGSGGYDDIRRDHERLRDVLLALHDKHPEVRVVVGMEATGGLERNWMAFFRTEKRWEKFVFAHRLNPLAVKRYLESDLHRKADDASAALGIAQFVMEKHQERSPAPDAFDGKVAFYRVVRTQILRRTQTVQRLQSLLPAVHPGLVQYCRKGVPDWVLFVITRYPTAGKLTRAKAEKLADLPHVDLKRAQSLIEGAKESVAALNDEGTALAIGAITDEIRDLDRRIDDGKERLKALLSDDPRVALLDSIIGIGTWSAIALSLEIGDVSRFATVRSLIAFAGLDPRTSVSGDGEVKHGISHRGNANIRATLFMVAQVALVHNPVIAAFYQRLTSGEKPKPGMVALTACMAKVLRIAYALLCSGRTFDAEYEENRAASAAATRQAGRSASASATPALLQEQAPALEPQLDAPITRKEARRRREMAAKNAAAPGSGKNEVRPQTGTGASAPPLSRSQAAAKRPLRRT
jgi:transposase